MKKMQIDENIAFNLKRIRKARNLSLDMVAEQTGVSKSMLGQIERGESNPTVSTIGKIVEGLKVPFEQLIYNKSVTVAIPTLAQAPVCREQPGRYSIHILLPYETGRNIEIYQADMESGSQINSSSHGEFTWEYLTVLRGGVELEINGETFCLSENESFYFACDREHTYKNTGTESAVLNMIVTREVH